MNRITVSADEVINLIRQDYSQDDYINIWIHILTNGFVFNEFALIWEKVYTYKVKIIDIGECGHKIHVKKIWEMPDHTHRHTNYDFTIEEYIDNLTNSMLKLKDKSFMDMSRDKQLIKESWFADVIPVTSFMQYVVYKAMNREVVEVGTTTRKYKPMSERTYKTSLSKVYKLVDVIRKYEKHLNHAKRHVTCDYWEVKGHFRHYKNGKVVYIKPYTKGKDKDNRSATDREYRL